MYPIERYTFFTLIIFGFYLVAASIIDSTASSGAAPKDINELSNIQTASKDWNNDPNEMGFSSSEKELLSMSGEKMPRPHQSGFEPPIGKYPPAELLAPGDKLSEEKRIQELLKWIQKSQAIEFRRGHKLGRQQAQEMGKSVRAPQDERIASDLRRKIKNMKSPPKQQPGDLWVKPPMLHTFDVQTAEGNHIKLSREYFPEVKTFLIVNTASDCSFTSQYEGLEKLYRTFKHQGLQIIAFPSNSFNLEPLGNVEIQEFVKEKYDVTFPVLAKVDVNGPDTPKIFNWLKTARILTRSPEWFTLEDSGLEPSDVQWNFEKFLIIGNNQKERIHRFSYDTKPEEITKYVEKTLYYVDMMGKKKEL